MTGERHDSERGNNDQTTAKATDSPFLTTRRRQVIGLLSSVSVTGCLRMAGDGTETTATSTQTSDQEESSISTDTAAETATESTTETAVESELSQLWQTSINLEGGKYNKPVTVEGGTAVVTGEIPEVKGINIATGEVNWTFTMDAKGILESWPASANGTAFVGDRSGTLYSLDVASGQLLSRATLMENNARELGDIYTFIANGQVISTVSERYRDTTENTKTSIKAFDLNSGDPTWSLSASRLYENEYAVFEGGIYTGQDGKIHLADSTIVNLNGPSVSFGKGMIFSRPAVGSGDIMYARAGDRGLRAFDLTTRKELWSYKTSQPSTGPCLAGNTVVFGSRDSHIYAFRRSANTSDGESAWEFQTNGEVRCRPAAQSGIVYAGSGDGYVYALNAEGGDVLDKIYVGEPLVAIVPTGQLVLALGNSNIYGLSPNA